MINRKEAIKQKGFNMISIKDNDAISSESQKNFVPVDFGKIKVGAKTLEDAVLDYGDFCKVDSRFSKKESILRAIHELNFGEMREISNFFYKTSGIYSRLCKYMAYMYRYDWMVTPYINEETAKDSDKDNALAEFYKILLFLDKSELKTLFGNISLKVIRNGCYYGYLLPSSARVTIQELPISYCRTRFMVNGRHAIEFNMKYFDAAFKDATQRMKMLNLFPPEFKKGYILYKEGKLPPQFVGDTMG